MEKYGNGNSTFGTLGKWLSKKTLKSPICKEAVKRFMADLAKNREYNPSSDTERQLVIFFDIFLIDSFLLKQISKQSKNKLNNLQIN